jgi:demethylmenaquinone methyltransferase/2-methoxy-6-polyprenyl-1,4-benzoquinol methylase
MALKESKVLERYFDTIAPGYETMNSLLSLNLDQRWRQRMIQILHSYNPKTILDVACGTCDVIRVTKSRLPEAQIIGLDLSYGMLEVAKSNQPELLILRGNGVELPFPDNSFEAITIAFGFRNMPSHKSFLLEAKRVLKSGGHLCILELTQPENPFFRFCNSLYLRTVLPIVSGFFGRDKEAYEYLANSIRHFPNQKSIISLILESGFAKARYELQTFGVTTLFVAECS